MLKQLAVCAALVGATSSVAVAGDGTNLTKYVADTTSVMIVLDVAGAKSTKLIKDTFSKLLESQADAKAKLDEIGLEPLRDIDTIAVTFGGFSELENLGDTRSMVMIVEGRMPKDLTKFKGASSRSLQDGVEIYTKDDNDIVFLDGRLFIAQKGNIGKVISFAKGKSKASLATGGGGKEMRDTIKAASTKSHMWGAVLLPKKDREKTVAAQMPLTAASFGFKFSSELDGGLRLESPSPAAAENTTKLLTGALPQVKMMMGGIGLATAANTIALAQDKAAVTAKIKISETELKGLFAMIQDKKSDAPAKPAPPPTKPVPTGGGLSGKP